jgi:hypothetical protein
MDLDRDNLHIAFHFLFRILGPRNWDSQGRSFRAWIIMGYANLPLSINSFASRVGHSVYLVP